ncbi:hypothetical protein NCAS_0A07280 [Naumovozyma castellii]|uniref:Rhodanese domain-containing protein n=1 Tax=Naumovozyma castellii TaxID=27288 RepID=G0V738_NAUCA|nr:hypothetical protein NCAS_0A07280 [Naumovozyma castellii CBS 4309]CCC67286.1 hypothetical protein NCAS_0A07280 [Naumovozyma castellii CBS 4309]
MGARSVTNIKYLDAADLHEWIKKGHTSLGQAFQVIDVRGSDYIGGHILGCWNYPYKKLSGDDATMEELRDRILSISRNHEDVIVNVVFHCAQSQQRGPSAAMKFLRALQDKDLQTVKVWILRGGFNHWQDVYGEDDEVTEGYEPALWGW